MSSTPRLRGLSTQVGAVAVSSVAAQVVTAAIYLGAARASSPEDYGAVVAGVAVALSCAGLVDFGANAYMVREMANSAQFLPEARRRLWGKLAAMAGLSVLAIVASHIAGAPTSIVLVVVVALMTGASLSFAAFARGLHRSDLVAVALLVDRLVAVVAMAALLLSDVNVGWALPVALSLGNAAGIGVLVRLIPGSENPWLQEKRVSNPWRGAAGFGVASVAGSLQALDTAVAGARGGPAVAGEYGAVSRWTQPVGVVATAYSSTAAPFFASARSGRAALRTAASSAWWLALGSFVALLTALFSDQLVDLLLGPNYRASGPVLMWLSLGVALSVWNQPAAVLLQARGMDTMVAIVRLGLSVSYLGAISVLVPVHGALGVAWSFVALQVLVGASFAGLVIAHHLTRKRERRSR